MGGVLIVVRVTVRWTVSPTVRERSKGRAGPGFSPRVGALVLVVGGVVVVVVVVVGGEEWVRGTLLLQACDKVPQGSGLVVIAY